MIAPEIPSNESERLEALYRYSILDSLPEKEYDAITQIAADICNTPLALITLVDPDRQWFKSHYGLDATETPREYAFCAHAIHNPDEVLIVPDANKDPRFEGNPLSTGDPHVIFYAGAPLKTKDGYALGTLCVIDHEPRKTLEENQLSALKALSDQVIANLELRKRNMDLEQANKEIERKNDQLKHFNYRISHDLKTPIMGVSSLIDFIRETKSDFIQDSETEYMFNLISERVAYMNTLVSGILDYTYATNEKVEFSYFNVSSLLREISYSEKLSDCGVLHLFNCKEIIHQSKTAFSHIFRNLISNSIKFKGKKNVTIWLTLKETEKFYHFIYEDDGPGIPEKYWNKIFIMFETLTESKELNTGIGLATVKNIIDRLGGKIKISHREEEQSGVLFKIALPKLNINKSSGNKDSKLFIS